MVFDIVGLRGDIRLGNRGIDHVGVRHLPSVESIFLIYHRQLFFDIVPPGKRRDFVPPRSARAALFYA